MQQTFKRSFQPLRRVDPDPAVAGFHEATDGQL